eukprot:gene17382-23685_t
MGCSVLARPFVRLPASRLHQEPSRAVNNSEGSLTMELAVENMKTAMDAATKLVDPQSSKTLNEVVAIKQSFKGLEQKMDDIKPSILKAEKDAIAREAVQLAAIKAMFEEAKTWDAEAAAELVDAQSLETLGEVVAIKKSAKILDQKWMTLLSNFL